MVDQVGQRPRMLVYFWKSLDGKKASVKTSNISRAHTQKSKSFLQLSSFYCIQISDEMGRKKTKGKKRSSSSCLYTNLKNTRNTWAA